MLSLGFVGTIRAGKDTLSDYLIRHYGFKKVSFGDAVRARASELQLPQNRETWQLLGQKERDKYGDEFWPFRVYELGKPILEINGSVAFNGLRYCSDVEILRGFLTRDFGIKLPLIWIDASFEIRHLRYGNALGGEISGEEFKIIDDKDRGIGDGACQETDKLRMMSDYHLLNESTPEYFFQEFLELGLL